MRFLIFTLFFLFGSCISSKTINTTIETISFGNGGGFTGMVKMYSLSAKGDLNKVDKNQISFIKKVNKKTVKQLFEKAGQLNSYQLNEPENIYSFIEIQTKEKKQKIIWGFGSKKVDTRVTILYNELIALTK
jgi:hypothetical protein